jgi:hypothetical protein
MRWIANLTVKFLTTPSILSKMSGPAHPLFRGCIRQLRTCSNAQARRRRRRQDTVAPVMSAPIAANDGRSCLARKRSLIAAGGSSPSQAGPAHALTEPRSAPDMSVLGPNAQISNWPRTSGQARACKQETGQPIRRARVRKVAAGPMQCASLSPRGEMIEASRHFKNPSVCLGN